jgi:hypothetical protein
MRLASSCQDRAKRLRVFEYLSDSSVVARLAHDCINPSASALAICRLLSESAYIICRRPSLSFLPVAGGKRQ